MAVRRRNPRTYYRTINTLILAGVFIFLTIIAVLMALYGGGLKRSVPRSVCQLHYPTDGIVLAVRRVTGMVARLTAHHRNPGTGDQHQRR